MTRSSAIVQVRSGHLKSMMPTCLLIALSSPCVAQYPGSARISDRVVLGKSSDDCVMLTEDKDKGSKRPGERDIHLKVKDQDGPPIVTGYDGKFTTDPLVPGDVLLELDKGDVKSRGFEEWKPASARVEMGAPNRTDPSPVCLLKAGGSVTNSQFKPLRPPASNQGHSPDGLLLFRVDPDPQVAASPGPPPKWNLRDVQGHISPFRGPMDESPHITIWRSGGENVGPELIQSADAAKNGDFALSLANRNLTRYDDLFITVSLTGFQSATANLSEDFINDRIGDQGALEFEVALVELSSPAPALAINREDAAPRAEYYRQDLLGLPVRDGRSLDSFALLAPGNLPAPQGGGSSGPGISPGIGTAGQFSANGLRARENNFTVDLSDNNDEEVGARRQGFVFPAPMTLESISEFQVINALADARYGRASGAQVNGFSLSGTSRYHMTAYSLGADDMWNARNFFDRPWGAGPPVYPVTSADGRPVMIANNQTVTGTNIPPVNGPYVFQPLTVPNPTLANPMNWHNRTGLSLNGPIRTSAQHLTFFNLAYEYSVTKDLEQEHFAVPTIDQRGFVGSGATGLNLVGGPALPSTTNGNAIFSLFPFPNNPGGPYGANTYTEAIPANSSGNLANLGIDQGFTAGVRHQLSLKYSFATETNTLPVTGGALYSSIRPRNQFQSGSATLSSNLPSFWLNTLRGAWGKTRGDYQQALPDPTMKPSSIFPSNQFLLNRPMIENITTPSSPNPELLSLSRETTDGYTGPLGEVNVIGYSSLGVDVSRFPQKRGDTTFQISDIVSKLIKVGGNQSHLLTFGTQFWRFGFDDTVNRNELPLAVFGGERVATPPPQGNQFSPSLPLLPGDPASQDPILLPTDFVALGRETSFYQTLASPQALGSNLLAKPLSLDRNQLDLFVNDAWSLGSRFRVTAGVRIEMNREPEDNAGQFQAEYNTPLGSSLPAAENAFLAACEAGFTNSSGAVSQDRCQLYFNSLPAALPPSYSQVFGANPLTRDVRLGFAWTPGKPGGTVLRAGWGTYTGQFPDVILSETSSYFPAFTPLKLDYPPLQGTLGDSVYRSGIINPVTLNVLNVPPSQSGSFEVAGYQLGVLFAKLSNNALEIVPTQPASGLHNPYARQYGVTLEQPLGRQYAFSVGYVGTLGRNLLHVTTPDQLTLYQPEVYPDLALALGYRLPEGHVPVVSRTLFSGTASSSYNSLQIQVRGSDPERALYFGSAFTYSHSIDNASDFFDLAGSYALPQDSFNPSEKGSSNFDVRLRWVSHFSWEPFHQMSTVPGYMGRLVREWSLSGIFTAQTGEPFTVDSAIDVNQDGNFTDRLGTTSGLLYGPTATEAQAILRLGPTLATRGLLVPGLLSQVEPTVQNCQVMQPSGNYTDLCDGAVGRNTFRGASLINLDLASAWNVYRNDRHTVLIRAEFFNALNRAQFALPVRVLEAPSFGSAVNTIVPNRSIQLSVRWSF